MSLSLDKDSFLFNMLFYDVIVSSVVGVLSFPVQACGLLRHRLGHLGPTLKHLVSVFHFCPDSSSLLMCTLQNSGDTLSSLVPVTHTGEAD